MEGKCSQFQMLIRYIVVCYRISFVLEPRRNWNYTSLLFRLQNIFPLLHNSFFIITQFFSNLTQSFSADIIIFYLYLIQYLSQISFLYVIQISIQVDILSSSSQTYAIVISRSWKQPPKTITMECLKRDFYDNFGG